MSDQPLPHTDAVARDIVLALGNPLRGDDGIGSAIIERLQHSDMPDGVTVMDGGTPGLETILLLQGYQRAIIVDAADMEREPGQWERITMDNAILEADDLYSRVTVHYAGLAEALVLGQALGILPDEIIIYGIQPYQIDWSPGLSAPVQAAIPAVCAAILKELQTTA